jgi:cytochrome c553
MSRLSRHNFVLLAVIVVGLTPPVPAADIDFSRDIQPLLAKRCFACHGPDTQEAGLRLDVAGAATRELDSGLQAIAPGDPAASEILARIRSTDPDLQMPPEGQRLSAAEVAVIREWIEAGATWEEHWAFRPLIRPEVPAVPQAANPIDAFIRRGLADRGLPLPAEAERRTLLRRVTYDLTGLPPSEQELADFLADASPAAWERVIDRLLASPHYGEQWARHWLDLVRYADTNSFERDGNKPHAWRYRDYVIRAFNDDKPYDRFVIEQLAGDELPEPTVDSLIATGYYRLGVWDDEPADKLQHRYDQLDDIVATTGQTFLGLTINCARCHDHKIDPLPQRDYYSLLAFFQNTTPMGARQMNPDFIERALPEGSQSVTDAQHQLREQRRQLREAEAEVRGIEKRIKEHGEQARDPLTEQDLKAWKEKVARLKRETAATPKALVISEHGAEAPATHVLYRGSPHAETSPETLVEPAFPGVLKAPAPQIVPLADGRSTGRRLALAKWITSPDNPLTARVIVNRIWQYHFGRGLVRSPSNFGFAGDPPTHPQLLDWLAAELVAGGWRLKALHKTILLSAAYRAASTGQPEALAADPLNDALWRFDMRRLSAEELRDTFHVVSGAFSPKMFGPGIYPSIPQAVLATQSRPGVGWGNTPPAEQARRSIYIHVKRSLLTPLLADFDLADTDTPCPVRFVTTQPTQALGMMNGEFIQRQARVFADRVRREAGGPDAADVRACVQRAIEIALVREPTADEIARGLALIDQLETTEGISPGRALELYCLLLLNLNEFAYLD